MSACGQNRSLAIRGRLFRQCASLSNLWGRIHVECLSSGGSGIDPDTLVVVNCAGRTRSIVGAQTLIDAGIPNRVVSLRDGTMAWLLGGRTLAQGRDTSLPEPGPATLALARERAARVAERAGVRRIDLTELALLEAQQEQHTLYRFDVRTSWPTGTACAR